MARKLKGWKNDKNTSLTLIIYLKARTIIISILRFYTGRECQISIIKVKLFLEAVYVHTYVICHEHDVYEMNIYTDGSKTLHTLYTQYNDYLDRQSYGKIRGVVTYRVCQQEVRTEFLQNTKPVGMLQGRVLRQWNGIFRTFRICVIFNGQATDKVYRHV